jgi:uncharacterized DUF497 family protein
MRFVWDTVKSIAHLQKHRVSFEESETVFNDPLAVTVFDQRHSGQEVREIIIDHSDFDRLLFVSFTERSDDIRLISARKATRQERKKYEDNISH